jgi:hypothetical protein
MICRSDFSREFQPMFATKVVLQMPVNIAAFPTVKSTPNFYT